MRLACLIHAANVRSEPGSNPSIGNLSQEQGPLSAPPPASPLAGRLRAKIRKLPQAAECGRVLEDPHEPKGPKDPGDLRFVPPRTQPRRRTRPQRLSARELTPRHTRRNPNCQRTVETVRAHVCATLVGFDGLVSRPREGADRLSASSLGGKGILQVADSVSRVTSGFSRAPKRLANLRRTKGLCALAASGPGSLAPLGARPRDLEPLARRSDAPQSMRRAGEAEAPDSGPRLAFRAA